MSLLSEELLKHQVANKVTSIDFSEPAIQHMVERQATNVEVVSALQGPSVEYLCMDATKLKFEDNSFDLVVEKGTLDALLTDEESQFSEKVEEGDGSVSSVSSVSSNSSGSGIVASVQARALLREARRVLSDDGIFIVVSHSDNRAVVIAEEGFHVEGPTKVVNGKASYYAYVCT
jgi:ubiquinone/menaquinone biosynthesis C-methylase UbiE